MGRDDEREREAELGEWVRVVGDVEPSKALYSEGERFSLELPPFLSFSPLPFTEREGEKATERERERDLSVSFSAVFGLFRDAEREEEGERVSSRQEGEVRFARSTCSRYW